MKQIAVIIVLLAASVSWGQNDVTIKGPVCHAPSGDCPVVHAVQDTPGINTTVSTGTLATIAATGPDVWDQNDKLLIHCAGWKSQCTLAEGRTLDDVAAYLMWREKARADADSYLVRAMDQCQALAEAVAKATKPATPPKEKAKP